MITETVNRARDARARRRRYSKIMAAFFHPQPEDISLTGVLAALGDPTRLVIVRNLAGCGEGRNCGEAAPCPKMSRSTLTSHFRILRESGLVRTTKKGVENINVLRRAEIDARFPKLLDVILGCAPKT